jgi:hypothetical protein
MNSLDLTPETAWSKEYIQRYTNASLALFECLRYILQMFAKMQKMLIKYQKFLTLIFKYINKYK